MSVAVSTNLPAVTDFTRGAVGGGIEQPMTSQINGGAGGAVMRM